MSIDMDEYDVVVNSDDTYRGIADSIKWGDEGSLMFNWTEGEGTIFTILMTYRPAVITAMSRGLKPTDLFVSIIGMGSFGFDTGTTDTHEGYIASKLGLDGGNVTSQGIADLINGIRKYL